MFSIKQCKTSADGQTVDAVQGLLKAVKPQRQLPPRQQGDTASLVQDFQLLDTQTNDFIYGSIWDHMVIDALVGQQVIMTSVKSGNGRFGGVTVKHNRDKQDASKVYVNLTVSKVGVVHTPETYAAATNVTPSAPAPAPTPAPTPAPVPQPAPVPAAQPAPVPQPTPAPVPQCNAPAPLPGSLQAAERAAVKEHYSHATFKDVVGCYQACYQAAHRTVNPQGNPDGSTLQAIQAGAATMMIACDKKGLIEGFSLDNQNPY